MRNVLSILFFLTLLIGPLQSGAAFYSTKTGHFSGWVSKVNIVAELVRFKVVFNNLKYVNKGDALVFWNGDKTKQSCKGYVIGKSAKYVLVKVSDFSECRRVIHLATGSYTKFFSQDLLNNIRMGKALVKILLKKHLALEGKMNRHTKNLESYIDKISAVNSRYQVLREKLQKEWREEVSSLEEDRLNLLSEYERTKTRLDDVNFKLEKYRISDDNFTLDRWSLDSTEYIPR